MESLRSICEEGNFTSYYLLIFSLQGDGAPENIHPHYLLRNGKQVNFTQSLPYMDQDVFKYEQLYLNIQLSFKVEFEWIETVVSLSCSARSQYLTQCLIA